MMDLADLRLASTRAAATQFGNLRFHRLWVLEGLARTAHRNMRHMTDAKARVGPRPSSPEGNAERDWISRIHSEMLRDQGISPDETSVLWEPWSTFLPVALYCAALSAEVEFLQDPPHPLGRLVECEAKGVLAGHSELVNALKGFRNGFLKPQASSNAAEEALFSRGLFNGIPALMASIDEIIAQIREGLAAEVNVFLTQLPREQTLLCWFRHLRQCGRNPFVRASEPAFAELNRTMANVMEDGASHSAKVRDMELSKQQMEKAYHVAELLCCVSGYEEMAIMGDDPEYDTSQPHFEPNLLRFLEAERDMAGLKFRGRAAAHVSKHMREYMKFLLTSAILGNETYQLLRKTSRNQSLSRVEDLTLAAQQVPANEIARITSLNLAQAALLTPIMQLYKAIRDENPHVSIPVCDQIVDNEERFASLTRFRNSVFHVERKAVDVERRDAASLKKIGSTEFLSELTEGVTQFLEAIRLGSVNRGTAG